MIKKRAKKMLILVVIIIMLLSVVLTACAEKANDFTEEEHIQRVTERIEKRFMTNENDYTGFSVYPLYTENDELRYFLVEFEPYGFLYVLLRDEQLKAFSFLGASTSMYKLSSGTANWSPYTIDETNSQPPPNTDECYEVDDNGERIIYNRSPFSIAGIKDEQRYLLCNIVPSVKCEGKFINLISLDEVEIIDGHFTKKQAYSPIFFNVKKQFDL